MEIRYKKYSLKKATICMVVGVAGSGKTTLAHQLVRQLANSAYLSKDMIQSAFTTAERLQGKIYSMIQGPTFKILVDFCDQQLDLEKHPVIDAPFSINHWRKDKYSEWLRPFREVSERKGAELKVIRCMPPDLRILKERIKQRRFEWDEWKLENWDEFVKREPLDFPIEHDDVFEVITDNPVELIVEKVCELYLEANPIIFPAIKRY